MGRPTEPGRVQRIDGPRAHRMSLVTLFAGLPASWVVAGIWSVIVGTSSVDGNPSVTGARAVLYDLPGSLLMIGVALTSLALAAIALRSRAHGAELGAWLSTAGLLLVLALIGTMTADAVVVPHSATLNWVVRAGAIVLTAAAMLIARRWAGASEA